MHTGGEAGVLDESGEGLHDRPCPELHCHSQGGVHHGAGGATVGDDLPDSAHAVMPVDTKGGVQTGQEEPVPAEQEGDLYLNSRRQM